jgi:hypothetical protein
MKMLETVKKTKTGLDQCKMLLMVYGTKSKIIYSFNELKVMMDVTFKVSSH